MIAVIARALRLPAAARALRRCAPLAAALAVAATPPAAPAEPEEAPEQSRGPQVETVVAALSQNRVSITADFSGSEIFVFGAVKREASPYAGKLDVIVEISGPPQPLYVRRKERMAGIWANRDTVRIDEAPSFYAISSTGPLEEVLSYTDDLRHRIGINHQVRMVDAGPVEEPEEFRRAVMRLRRKAGLYIEDPGGVDLIDGTLFKTHVGLPANLVEGNYRARVFLLHDRKVTDVHESLIYVRKVGLERWVYALSRERPALYGALSLLVALFAGWAASEAFRILRR